MDELAHKSIASGSVEIKDAEKGIVQAVVGRVGVKDHEDDIFLPGSFGERAVRVSAYNHRSWPHRGGLPPVGKGTIKEVDDRVVADIRFFMSTVDGREAFTQVKEMAELQEWSFGWLPGTEKYGEVTDALREMGVRRAFESVPVVEVSPVLMGASVGTHTTAVKLLSKARTPTFDGTEDVEWSAPTLEDYVAGLGLEETRWDDLPTDAKNRIAAHTLVGQGSAGTFDEANAFPVVNPRTGKLNAAALRNAAARASEANIGDATAESIKTVAARLLDEKFSKDAGAEPEVKESDEDRSELIRNALQERFGGAGRRVWLAATYSDEGLVVYESWSDEGGAAGLYRVAYEMDEEGAVTLGEPEEVRRVTTFEPVPKDLSAEEEIKAALATEFGRAELMMARLGSR